MDLNYLMIMMRILNFIISMTFKCQSRPHNQLNLHQFYLDQSLATNYFVAILVQLTT